MSVRLYPLVALMFVAGCVVHRCKAGTLLVHVELVGAAASADALAVDVTSDGAMPAHTRLAHKQGDANGTIEIEFPHGYPAGAPVTVTVTALQSGQNVGKTMVVALLGAVCDTTSISIGDDGSGGGGVGPDLGCGGPSAPCSSLVLPADPEFKDVAAWTLTGGAEIDPTAPGLDDVGELVLSRPAACGGGSAHTSVAIPAFADSGALALTHTVQRTCSAASHACMGGTVGVRFGGGVIAVPATETLVRSKTCLGARAYGATVDFAVGAGDANDCADPMLSNLEIRVDRLSIQPEAVCPDPGSVKNSNFDGDGNAWIMQLDNGTATIDPGIGVGGSRAGHITTSKLCQAPKLRGLQSVPTGPQVALSLLVKGTAGKAALVGEETSVARWASIVGTGVFETPRLCVPEYAKGMVLPLLLSTETPTGSCATLDVRDFVFDDVSFVVEPSCPMTAYVIDPGFERFAAVPQWNLAVNGGGGATATVVEDAMQAHAGTHALKLAATQTCASARANTVVTVPEPAAGAGPALKLWYRAPMLSNAVASATAQNATVKLAPSDAYKQATVCLDPARAGQGLHVEVTLSSAGLCGKTFAEEATLFDDFEATTDASCPTK